MQSRSWIGGCVLVHAQEPPHKKVKSHADVPSGARGLNFGLRLYLHPNFVYASAKALVSLQISSGLSEPLLLQSVISTKFSCAEK